MANQITPDLLKLIRADMDAALKSIAEKHGVTFEIGRFGYTQQNASVKLQVNALAADGSAVTKEMTDLKRYAPLHRLTEEHLKQEFNVGPERFVLVGYRSKAPVKPFLAKNVRDGKHYILTERQVHHGLGIKTEMVVTRIS